MDMIIYTFLNIRNVLNGPNHIKNTNMQIISIWMDKTLKIKKIMILIIYDLNYVFLMI